MILLLLVSFGALSQSDSVCYSSEENIRIAAKLLEGKKCENSLAQAKESYEDCECLLIIQSEEMAITNSLNSELNDKIEEKDQRIERLEGKVKRRNRTIFGLVVVEVVTVFLLVVSH